MKLVKMIVYGFEKEIQTKFEKCGFRLAEICYKPNEDV